MRVKIGGIKEISLVDVVDNVSFTVWFSFCNFRCPWCQNWSLVEGEGYWVEVDEIVEKASKYKGVVDYLHVTGGEPTVQKDALEELFRKSPLKNSLNTNGSNPEVVKRLKLDHIAIDFKAPKEKYSKVVGVDFNFETLLKTFEISKKRVNFIEIRTTVVPDLVEKEDVLEIARTIRDIFEDYDRRLVYVLQQFYPWETIKFEEFRKKKPTDIKLLEELGKKIKREFELEVYIRSLEGIRRLK